MVCSQCQRSGYNFHKVEGKTWCGTCEGPGTRTVGVGAGGYSGRMGAGTVTGLPKLVSLSEWQEIVQLCKKVSGRGVLTESGKAANLLDEGPFTPLPLPNMKNPLDERPTDKRAGWTPLEEYFKTLDGNQPPPQRKGHYGNLFG